MCILRLDFASAIHHHVLSIPLFFGALVYLLIFGFDIFFSKNNAEKIERFLAKKYMYLVYVFILFLSVCYNRVF